MYEIPDICMDFVNIFMDFIYNYLVLYKFK